MARVFVLELPFDYSLYFTTNQLLMIGGVALFVLVLVCNALLLKVRSGREALKGQCVKAVEDFAFKEGKYQGQVICMGEIWNAQSGTTQLKKGEHATVSSSKKLLLILE